MNALYSSQRELVSFVPLLSWMRAAVRCGFSMAPVLHEIDIPVVDNGTYGVVITHAQSCRLIEACTARARREHFPFVLGENATLESIPEVQAFIFSCASLRDAINYYNRVRQLMSNGSNMSLHETEQHTQIAFHIGDPEHRNNAAIFFTETLMTSMVKLICQLVGPGEIERLAFRHAPPSHAAAYASFFGIPIQFGQASDALVIRTALLDRKLDGAGLEGHQQASSRPRHRSVALPASASMVGQLNHLFSEFPDLLIAGIDAAASTLNITPRTLQRRLRDEHQTFSEVQSQSLFQMTCSLLRNTHYSVDEISQRLGFSDRRAFSRAFKRWSNISPSDYRNAPVPERYSSASA